MQEGLSAKESLEIAIRKRDAYQRKFPYRDEFSCIVEAMSYLKAQHFKKRGRNYYERFIGGHLVKAWVYEVNNVFGKKRSHSYTFVGYAK